MWIIFEGLDKVGKTTLEWELLKATNFKHIIIDRGPVGYLVFDKIFERETKLGNQEFIHQARKIMKSKDFMVIYCTANKDIVDARLKEHNESCPYDYEKAQKLYKNNIHRFYRNNKVIEIDTTSLSIEKCIEIIIEKLEEVQKGEL